MFVGPTNVGKIVEDILPPDTGYKHISYFSFCAVLGKWLTFSEALRQVKKATFQSEILSLESFNHLAQLADCPFFPLKNHSTLIYTQYIYICTVYIELALTGLVRLPCGEGRETGSLELSRKLGVYTRKLGVYTRKLGFYTRKLGVYTRKLGVYTRKLGVYTRKLGVFTRKLGVYSRKLGVYTRKLGVYTRKLGASQLLLSLTGKCSRLSWFFVLKVIWET